MYFRNAFTSVRQRASADCRNSSEGESQEIYCRTRTLTAEDLGISRKTLFNKMKRYELGS
jgi:transcriptional regulator of acetoin/glycerol metabolism